MASITPYKTNQGQRYKAQIRFRSGGKVLYSESKGGFHNELEALEWSDKRERQLSQKGALDKVRFQQESGEKVPVGKLLQLYIDHFGAMAGRSKLGHLKQLQGFSLASLPSDRLTSDILIQHITERRETVSAATAGNDLIWLGVVFDAAGPVWKIPVDASQIDLAKRFCRKHRMIGKSRKRERRASDEEHSAIIEHFKRKAKKSDLPMVAICEFARHSARRQGEVVRILWSDNDKKHKTGMVRDVKHPYAKEGNHKRFKYTDEAWEIIKNLPRTDDRIFPFNGKTISAYFTNACHLLGISDLTFHDYRHDACSRLFEGKNKGRYSIPEAQLITLHERWDDLKRYTNLKPEDLD
jgi:integrase